MDRDKAITAMQESIAFAWQENAEKWGHTVGDTIDSKVLAETALDALVDYLPDVSIMQR